MILHQFPTSTATCLNKLKNSIQNRKIGIRNLTSKIYIHFYFDSHKKGTQLRVLLLVTLSPMVSKRGMHMKILNTVKENNST